MPRGKAGDADGPAPVKDGSAVTRHFCRRAAGSDSVCRPLPELLLPAGDMECVRAAVQNGADAVYLGGKRFSARQNAENFTEDGLHEAVSYCHARGVRVYQTLNTLLFDSQWGGLGAAVEAACGAGVDALIVQDWGVLRYVREHAPGMRLHGSTQMSVHTPAAARLLAQMGVSRVVLARELSLAEIAEITAAADIECEVFVHGALCMAVSGQCYLSAMLGGRSGNRGACAGPCRLPFAAGGEAAGKTYPCGAGLDPPLARTYPVRGDAQRHGGEAPAGKPFPTLSRLSGGRLGDETRSVPCQAGEEALAGKPCPCDVGPNHPLARTYPVRGDAQRQAGGETPAGKPFPTLPRHSGGRLGDEARSVPCQASGETGNAHRLSLKDLCLTSHLAELAEAGAASLKIEGRMKRPEYVAAAAAAYRSALGGAFSENPDDSADSLELLRAVFSRSGFTDGYLTGKRTDMFGVRQKEDVASATPKLLRSLQNTYQKEHGRIPLALSFTCRRDEPCRLEASDPDGNRAEAVGPLPLPATGRPLDAASAAASLQKLGGTIFVPGEFRAELDEGLFLPAAGLNRLRREVCEAIYGLRAKLHPLEYRTAATAPFPDHRRPAEPAWEASFRRAAQLSPALAERFAAFSLPLSEVFSHAHSLQGWRDKLRVEPPRAMFGREAELRGQLEALREQGFTRLSCQNLGHLALARELGLEAHGGAFLNCTNSASAAELASLGVRSQTLSFECRLPDARAVRAAVPLGIDCYGYLPLMLTRNCPVREAAHCQGCGGRASLTDRKGVTFPVLCGEKRYAELLNSAPLWMADRLDECRGFDFLRFVFTFENRAECESVLTRYGARSPYDGTFTRGLYYRSV